MSGTKRSADRKSETWSCVMAIGRTSFTCSNCDALYHVVRQEAGPETIDHDIRCRACGAPFAARDGKFVPKYFLSREGERIQRRRRA
jgi:DNA-directed RNA polymerase subunit RPC12/RpoP